MIELVEALRFAIPRLMAAISENPYFDIDPNLVHTIEKKLQNLQIDYEKIVGSILPAVKEAATGGISTVSQISMSIFQGIRSLIGFGAFLGFVAVLNFYLMLDKDRNEHTDMEFTHGICPECIRKLYPGLANETWLE